MIVGNDHYVFCSECNSTLRAVLVGGKRVPVGVDVRVYEEALQLIREGVRRMAGAERVVLRQAK